MDEQPNPDPIAPPVDAPPAAPPVAEILPEPPIAPGVARLGAPRGAASRVNDPSAPHPSYVFLAAVSILTLVADLGSKQWAVNRLESGLGTMRVWDDHLQFILAHNPGGAWGLLQSTNENVRRPFFLLVSAGAIAFIVTLYRRLQKRQRALKWGLPLVLGGALGNVFDRIKSGKVVDFIDYRAEWVRKMNDVVGHVFKSAGTPTDHWPTFNVADVAICIGVALMAIDMFSSKRGKHGSNKSGGGPKSFSLPPPPPPDQPIAMAPPVE